MKNKPYYLLNSAGDTIVEVLVVLAVLGLAFAISYATANSSLIKSRNAEEHSEALGQLNTQVELMRAAFEQNITIPTRGKAFCMLLNTPIPTASTVFNPIPNPNPALDNYATYPAQCRNVNNSFYNVSIYHQPLNDTYDFRVRWFGIGSLGRQQEEIIYRINTASINNPPYIDPL